MRKKILTKQDFLRELKIFVQTLTEKISLNDEWTMRGVIDIFEKIYPLPPDTKVLSKILELHLFPHFLQFAETVNFNLELAEHQNWYPDLTFISKENSAAKFAVDLKTTYRDEKNPNFCNGFTLGSHGEYFVDRKSTKNVQYPYGDYLGHFCVGIIYTRRSLLVNEFHSYSVTNLAKIPALLSDFILFAEEKWKIAADIQGSGNTANIGSIKCIEDILSGRGVFSLAGEEFLSFKGLSPTLNCSKRHKKRSAADG